MSSRRIQKTQIDFYGYPPIRQGPETSPYTVPSGSNPVLRGLPLAIVGTMFVCSLSRAIHRLMSPVPLSSTSLGTSYGAIPDLAYYGISGISMTMSQDTTQL